MAKPSISTSLGKRKRKNLGLAQRLAGEQQSTAQGFQSVYGAPKAIQDRSAAAGVPPVGVGKARATRSKFSDALLQGGGRAKLRNALGPNYQQGDLAAALTTLRTARQKVAAGEAPPELLTSDLVTRAQRQATDWLGTRKRVLRQRYMAS